ncbi:MAG: ABC transporter substrate-binding protein [Solirubrobacterales bacterium]
MVAGGGSADAGSGQHSRELRGAFSSFPDYMDPQLSYTAEGWTAMYDSYIPLLTYKHAEGKPGAEVIPGLARRMPRIGDGGRTYTLFLRKGLRYSDGTPVRASDFEFAVERMFRLNSGGSPFYADIVGAQRFERKRSRGIAGIKADNRTGKIVIHLVRPRATFTDELALMFVAPVPPDTPLRAESRHPPPATGPYVITQSQPGRGWTYARNPEWRGHNGRLMPQLPDGHVGRIRIEVVRDGAKEVRMVERGELDWMQNPPPTPDFMRLERKYGGTQFRVEPTLSTYYFWMNTQKAPFSSLKVRRAVNYAIDPEALRNIYGGQMTPTHQVLPPGMPGYRKLDLYPHSMAKARRLIAEADPSDRNITVWTDNEAPNYEAGIYYRDVLRKLGFHAHLEVRSGDNYFTVIGNRSTPNLDTGWSDWFEDYPHPNDFFQPLLAGSSILRFDNGNFAQLDVPSVNQKIKELREALPLSEAGYAALDKRVMELAPWAPYGTRVLSTFVSRRVDLSKMVWNPTFGADLASFQLKASEMR